MSPTESDPIRFRVAGKNQFASGGSFLVRFDVEAELRPGDPTIDVEIVSSVPPDAYGDFIVSAREAIARGVRKALPSSDCGASLRVRDIVIHDVDFSPYHHERLTAEAFRVALDGQGRLTQS